MKPESKKWEAEDMILKIDSVSDLKTDQRGTSAKIKCGNDSYFVNEDPTAFIGKQVEAEVSERTSKAGNKYKIAKLGSVITSDPVAEATGGASSANGKPTLDEFLFCISKLHEKALAIEPDLPPSEGSPGWVDRSEQRAKIVISGMIAFADGKIVLGDDDQIPF